MFKKRHVGRDYRQLKDKEGDSMYGMPHFLEAIKINIRLY